MSLLGKKCLFPAKMILLYSTTRVPAPVLCILARFSMIVSLGANSTITNVNVTPVLLL